MNIKQLVSDELKRILTDVENSELADDLKAFVETELTSIESRLQQYIDAQFSKLSTTAASANVGKPVAASSDDPKK